MPLKIIWLFLKSNLLQNILILFHHRLFIFTKVFFFKFSTLFTDQTSSQLRVIMLTTFSELHTKKLLKFQV